jgi:hypothetical protein
MKLSPVAAYSRVKAIAMAAAAPQKGGATAKAAPKETRAWKKMEG